MDCELDPKHQRRACGICVIHVHAGVAPGVVTGPGMPGQGLRVVSRRTLKDALKEIALTSQYDEDVENASMEVWGTARKAAKRGELHGATSRLPPCVDCGLHYRHQGGIWGVCVTHVLGGVAPGVVTCSWARFSSCKLLDTERRYRTHLWVFQGPWECAHGSVGAARKEARRGGSPGVLQSWLPPRGLHDKHQRGTYGIYVMHVHGGTAPGVVTPSGRAGQGHRVVSHWTVSDDIVLTSGYSKGLRMRTWKCGGGEEGGEEGESFRVLRSRLPLRVDCGLHHKHQ